MYLASLKAAVVVALAVGGAGSRATADVGDPLVLAAPVAPRLPPLRVGPAFPDAPAEAYLRVTADEVALFAKPKRRGWGIGALRRGAIVAGTPGRHDGACATGWFELLDGAWLCRGDGTETLEGPEAEASGALAPDRHLPLPFRYAKVEFDAPIFARPLDREEVHRLRAARPVRAPVVDWAEGVVFRAVDRGHEVGGRTWLQLVDDTWVRAEDARIVEPPRATGQPLHEGSLPIAFVIDDDVGVFELGDDPAAASARRVGRAQRYARFEVARERTVGDTAWLVGDDGRAVAATHVRVARARARPRRVPAGSRWMHVDLDAQVLVAYDDETPVYVTLVASGKPGFDTPRGLYRIRRKYVVTTMAGPDPDHGTYDIGDVPWTMYYRGGLALHGAYWHDAFGRVRSHGCTNLPPAAARWLFRWSSPQVPPAYEGVHEAGTWIYFTRA